MKLEVDAVVRRSSGFTLDVSVRCDGDSIGLVGPSGCGKSTLVESIAGIQPGARVVVDGTDWSRMPIHSRELGYVAQDPLLFPHLDVLRNLLFSPRARDPAEVARLFSIEPLLGRMPRHLSGGERRRVALARALASRPRLLLLDEPTTGLDEKSRRDVLSLLDRVRRTLEVPMLLVSHRADEVLALTDRVLRLESGRVVSEGPSAEVLEAEETRVDTYLVGRVEGAGRVKVGATELAAVLPPEARGEVRLACYANDIILSRDRHAGVSARNVLPVTVRSAVRGRAAVLVEIDPPPLRALVTPEAARSLELAPGAPAFALVKATALTYLGPA